MRRKPDQGVGGWQRPRSETQRATGRQARCPVSPRSGFLIPQLPLFGPQLPLFGPLLPLFGPLPPLFGPLLPLLAPLLV